jgi:hypothetical protein
MALELEGRIARKFAPQTGTSARGAWSKQEFIFEYQEGQFPTQICMNVWGEDKVRELEKYQVGDKVKISFNLSSREYNSRWYTDVRAWRIEPAGAQPQQASYNGASYGQQPSAPQAPVAPAPTIDDLPADEDGDLPF